MLPDESTRASGSLQANVTDATPALDGEVEAEESGEDALVGADALTGPDLLTGPQAETSTSPRRTIRLTAL